MRQKPKVLDLMVQAIVQVGVEKQYDRYAAVEFACGRVPVNLSEFMNQLIVRGMVSYNDELVVDELMINSGQTPPRMFDVIRPV